MEKGWKGLPYRPISEMYTARFGAKAYKIPIAFAESCPNREGLKGMTTCVFCDEWGSAARADSFKEDLDTQLLKVHHYLHKKHKAKYYLAYFQAYTNTFVKLSNLSDQFSKVMNYDFINGIVIGTRPDCISKGVLDLWNEYSKKTYLGIEIGVQSFYNDQLEFLKRGHTSDQSIKAINKIATECSADLGIHLIFGLPDETDQQIIETARICNDLPISNVKLHNLHVLKNTPLESMFNTGDFKPVEFEDYTRKVQLFLEHLSPRIFIHRLAAYSSRWNELVAPDWTADKMKTHQGIIDHLRSKDSWQSKSLVLKNPSDKELQKYIFNKSRQTIF